jgi:hypothetical protein
MTQPPVAPPVLQRTFVYVDGFNLYYRCLKGTPYKWLDLISLFRSILRPTNDILRIRYFTADVSGKRDAGAPIRQQIYLRALSALPQIAIHKGSFLVSARWAGLAAPPGKFVKPDPVTAYVLKTEEKGSDVNLATYLGAPTSPAQPRGPCRLPRLLGPAAWESDDRAAALLRRRIARRGRRGTRRQGNLRGQRFHLAPPQLRPSG